MLLELSNGAPDADWWVSRLREHGVAVRPRGSRRLRLVTHRHHDDADIAAAVAAFGAVAGAFDAIEIPAAPL